MAVRSEEDKQTALKTLSAINTIARLGGTDSIISGNSTITALSNAIMNLPNLIGTGDDANKAVVRGLKLGVLSGALSETHGFTTINGMRDAVWAQIGGDVDRDTDRFLPQ